MSTGSMSFLSLVEQQFCAILMMGYLFLLAGWGPFLPAGLLQEGCGLGANGVSTCCVCSVFSPM